MRWSTSVAGIQSVINPSMNLSAGTGNEAMTMSPTNQHIPTVRTSIYSFGTSISKSTNNIINSRECIPTSSTSIDSFETCSGKPNHDVLSTGQRIHTSRTAIYSFDTWISKSTDDNVRTIQFIPVTTK